MIQAIFLLLMVFGIGFYIGHIVGRITELKRINKLYRSIEANDKK
jgi:hypothetical protein